MSEEKKYPIKFAVLELKKHGGWIVGYNDITLGYIVSKCYVVESSIKYLPSGDTKISHKVVFPFKDINIEKLKLDLQKEQQYYIGEKITPCYDTWGNSYPVDIVSNIFESYEEAKQEAEIKNKEIMKNLILEVSSQNSILKFKEEYENLKKQFTEQLTICQAFEQLVTIETADMDVSSEISIKLNKKKL